jgi:phosphoserine phosphatase
MDNRIKLVIFDLDNTLTTGPTIWELIHREQNTWQRHGLPLWEQFHEGDFGINAFINKDVACWAGMPINRIQSAIKKIKYIPKIKETIRALKKQNIKTALISSSVDLFADNVAAKFGIDHVFANVVEVKNKKLTGKVVLKVPGKGKGKVTRILRRSLKLKKAEVLAVGDSEFDFPMFDEVGISVTFNDARKTVQKKADHVIAKNGLLKLLEIMRT